MRISKMIRIAEPRWTFLNSLMRAAMRSGKLVQEYLQEQDTKAALSNLLSMLGVIGATLRYFGYPQEQQQIDQIRDRIETSEAADKDPDA